MGVLEFLFSFFGCSRRSGYEDIQSGVDSTIIEEPAVIAVDDDNSVIVCSGFHASLFRTFVLRNCFCICLAGIPYLFLKWYPHIEAHLFLWRCALESAQIVLVKDEMGESSLHSVYETSESESDGSGHLRYFIYKLQRMYWCQDMLQFVPLKGLGDGNTSLSYMLHTFGEGQTLQQKNDRLDYYGKNVIVVKGKSYCQLLVDEILNPFYIFEGLSVTLWIFDEYTYYALFILAISLISIQLSLRQTKRQLKMLHEMISSCSSSSRRVIVHMPESGCYEESCEELVPGDVIEIPPSGCVMMCDALLLTGTCIVNESSLTGESQPVTKVPPINTNEIYQPKSSHMKHTLYCGTQILQTRYYENNKVLAMVTETGSNTAKGQLIRSILYPKTMAFDFMAESIKYIAFLFLVAFLAMSYSSYLYMLRGASLETLLLRTLDLVTIIVPPTLPAAMTAGSYYSQKRLKRKGIFCISPTRIVVSGKTSLVCFDKTGTLTEEGMEIWGVVADPIFRQQIKNSIVTSETLRQCPPPLSDDYIIKDLSCIDDKSVLKTALASCHSLTIINNEICGEPLDVTMFKATGWELEEPGEDTSKFDRLEPMVVRPKQAGFIYEDKNSWDEFHMPYEVGMIRLFPFTSSAQNMTVICRVLGARNMIVFSKGAPEKIISLCESLTIPEDVFNTLARFSMAGLRVIALASKEMPKSFTWAQSQRIQRDQIEKDLHFIGLLLVQNNLKQQSQLVIGQLKTAGIKCIMATGDNVMTAISVSRTCGILPPVDDVAQVVRLSIDVDQPCPQISVQPVFGCESSCTVNLSDSSVRIVMDGSSWSYLRAHFPMCFDAITIKTIVFARMSPQQKTQLIETLQQLNYCVIMCGDGANDCGALKAANVGIALSRTEASIAAPFTSSKNLDGVLCVIELIKEGRCALATSFSLFNYMTMYSLIQFFSVIILYSIGAETGTIEFLYVDVVVTTSLVMLMGFSGPSGSLITTKYHPPTTSLLSVANVTPLLLQIATVFAFQLIALCLLQMQTWYVPVVPAEKDDEVVLCWENTVVYSISCFQYLIFAFLYSTGRPHRESILRNRSLVVVLILLFIFTNLLVFYPPITMSDLFEMEPWSPTDRYFRLVLIILPMMHLFISYFIQLLFADGIYKLIKIKRKGTSNSERYKAIEEELQQQNEGQLGLQQLFVTPTTI